MQLILHIGAAKCASTTVQNYISDNARNLYKDGYAIFDTELKCHLSSRSIKVGVCDPIQKLLADEISGTELKSRIESGLSLAAKNGFHSVILSGENIARFKKNDRDKIFRALNGLFKKHRIRVVYYIRRQDYWLESAWKQWALKHDGRPFSVWLKGKVHNEYPNFYPPAHDWCAYVGADQFHINYIDSRFLDAGDVIHDFCRATGLPLYEGSTATRANTMLDPAVLHYLHAHRHIFFNGMHDNYLFDTLAKQGVGQAQAGRARLLENQERIYVCHAFKKSNNSLLTEFFHNNTELREYLYLEHSEDKAVEPTDRTPDTSALTATGMALNTRLLLDLLNETHKSRRAVRLVEETVQAYAPWTGKVVETESNGTDLHKAAAWVRSRFNAFGRGKRR